MNIPAARIVFSDDDRASVLAMIDQSLQTGALTLGPYTRELEDAFRARHDAPFAVAVSSGTSAIEIILRTIGVEGREVVVPANTFFATAAAVIHTGGRVRFADCEPESFALDSASLKASLRPETAAVILVHIGGLITSNIDEIRRICGEAG